MNQEIRKSIDEAAKVIGKTWPLYTFVASNPLAGYENMKFSDALKSAEKNFNAQVFPEVKLYRQALEKGAIDSSILASHLENNGITASTEECLQLIASQKQTKDLNPTHTVDRIMAKWLALFMDEGLAEWEMPFKSEGFYTAWRFLVIYDSETGKAALKDVPKSSEETLMQLLKEYNQSDYTTIFEHHLAALPGWTGYINHRIVSGSDWQKDFPISLIDYLAVRLWTTQKLKLAILPKVIKETVSSEVSKLQHIFLKAWEQSWQTQLVKTLENQNIKPAQINETNIPDAQMVFCIDTRSELIRRHVESTGNYETYGYAGFFGIAMDYKSLDDGIIRKACPPIVSSAYTVIEAAQTTKELDLKAYERKIQVSNFKAYFLKRMKNMLPSAFGYVEGSGLFYGLSLIGRTLLPRQLYKANKLKALKQEHVCQPDIHIANNDNDISFGITLEEKVSIVKSAFKLTGWKQFAPLVIFAGHGSHSANNPFSSSLDCGACAASPGRHNARMLAKLANLPEVKNALAEFHDILIPENTFFIGAEHNTTTDAIVLFDSEVPESHKPLVHNLKSNLVIAQQNATQDRLGSQRNSVSHAQKKANDWGETRPEWGLAKNAGFIVGPRSLTKNTNLNSRCFLHSYDWKQDAEGKALEGIMQGPMVVTQWINNHYYFSTVDNNVFGGGSKITHNITGKFGVVQGNGGDLKMGLPLQSLNSSDDTMYHQPLRLTVMIQAPITIVSDILVRNENLKLLLDNEWIYLMVMDPNQNNAMFRYKKSIQWEAVSKKDSRATMPKKDKAELAYSE